MRILGEVVATTRGQHQFVEVVQQFAETVRTGRNVERKGPPRLRKAEGRRVGRTETLEHREEAGRAAGAEPFDHGAHRFLLPEGHDELVLHHAGFSVQPVPATEHVERVEELGDAMNVADLVNRRLAEPHLVERSNRRVIEHARPRHQRWNRQELAGAVVTRRGHSTGIELVEAGVIAARQHAATEAATLRHHIDPGDAVAVVVVVGHGGEERIEIGDA